MFKWFRGSDHLTESGPVPARSSNYDDAVKWYRRAADKGTSWGQFNLGVSYARGQGVPQDFNEATGWFRRAAEQGEAMSQFSLGQMYERGLGVEVDQAEAYKWFQLAAWHGIAGAEKAREDLRQGMATEQIVEGVRRAATFVPKTSSHPKMAN